MDLTTAIAMRDSGDTPGAVEALLTSATDLRSMIEAAHHFARWDTPEAALTVGIRISALFPNDPNGPFHVAGALRRLGRIAEAEDLLHDAPFRWAGNAGILSIWASFPMHRSAWSEALGRWDALIERFPSDPKFPAMKARCLIFAGRLDDADDLLRATLSKFPDGMDCKTVAMELVAVRGRSSAR